MNQIKLGTSPSIRKCIVVIQRNIISSTASSQIYLKIPLLPENLHRTLPTRFYLKIRIVKSVRFHGVVQYISVERFVVGHHHFALHEALQFGVNLLKSGSRECIFGGNTVHFGIVVHVIVAWRLDERIKFLQNFLVFDMHNTHRTCRVFVPSGCLKIYRYKFQISCFYFLTLSRQDARVLLLKFNFSQSRRVAKVYISVKYGLRGPL